MKQNVKYGISLLALIMFTVATLIFVNQLSQKQPNSRNAAALTSSEKQMLARFVEFEAGRNDSVNEKQMVVDVVLNRIEHEKYPDNVHDVLMQPGQFLIDWNRIATSDYTNETYEIIEKEIANRTNSSITSYFLKPATESDSFPEFQNKVGLMLEEETDYYAFYSLKK